MRYSLQRTAICKHPMRLGITVILVVNAVPFSMLLVVHLIYSLQVNNMMCDALVSKAPAVVRMLISSPEIRQGLMKKLKESGIQTITRVMNKSNDFLFIVVTDMQSIRYSHPGMRRIGQPLRDDDILLALQGKENVATSRGFLAKALHVFAPVYDEHHRQIDVVLIGLELSQVAEQINDGRSSIIWLILFGVLVGLFGTRVFVEILKRILSGLGPYEISNLFEQRQAVLRSIKEGIIVADECDEVTLINQTAQELLDYHKSQGDAQLFTLSHAWSQVVDFSQTLHDGAPRRGGEIMVKDQLFLINTVPIFSNGKVIGAISTFGDKTEVRKLMQRLDSMVNCADTLRERSREFMNKLHVILGSLYLKSHKQLKNYILKTIDNYQEEIGSLLGKIKSSMIAGFLLSKINHISDLGHSLVIGNENQLLENSSEDQVAVSITVLENLIENALEALGQEFGGEISVSLHCRHNWLHCEVSDNGPGIVPENIEYIFRKGVSPKGAKRGVGLALAKQQVENVGGNTSAESELGIFTQFFVQLPWNGERADR